ncbi:MAG: helix-turn-helix transcriptional regulator [Prevotella sp.]|nr:helix-turn-helix transcriptional regulator [Prevotella sp.]
MEKAKDFTEKQEQLARFAKVLGHPVRIAVLQFLARQEECYFGDIHEVLPIAKATVSQHLTELKNAGLIRGAIEGPKVKYCIDAAGWGLARELFGELFSSKVCNQKGCC